MHWIALAALALVAGFGISYVNPIVTKVIPASYAQNKFVVSFVNGAAILITIFIAILILSVVGLKPKQV